MRFFAQVRGWSERTQRNAGLVLRQSAQDVIGEAQEPVGAGGNMPVDTGFLRNSLASSLNGSTALSGANSYILAIAGMDLGDVLEAGWTADYALHVEHGARGRPGRYFMRNAALNWQAIVNRNAARVRQ